MIAIPFSGKLVFFMDVTLERIGALISKYKTTEAKLCAATGIRKSTFTDWRANRSKPKLEAIQKIAEYFGVSIDFLLGHSDKQEENISADKFGAKITALRKARSLSESEVSVALQIAPSLLAKYESGITLPNVMKLVEIAKYYSVSVDYLLETDAYHGATMSEDDKLSLAILSQMRALFREDENTNHDEVGVKLEIITKFLATNWELIDSLAKAEINTKKRVTNIAPAGNYDEEDNE